VTQPDTEYYRLRTEWLRFKSHLVDSLTGLPALPAVVEDVRRVLEARGSAVALYVDLGQSGWQEAKLGWAAYDEAIREFAGALLSLRESGELLGQDVVCLHTVRSDRFLVFLAGGGEGRNGGGGSAAMRRERLLSAVRARIGVREGSPLKGVRISTGYASIQLSPAIRAERAIHQAVSDAMAMSLAEREDVEVVRRDELSRLVAGAGVRTAFHPIVRLLDGAVIGHEALTRPTYRVNFASVEDLFAFAEGTDLLVDFERLCRATAVRSWEHVPARGLLFLNASAQAVEDPEWLGGAMDDLLKSHGLSPRQVVVEVTERVAVVRRQNFHRALHGFKARGYGVAVDDMGAGHASLQALASIEPDFLKFDSSLVRDIDRNSIKRGLLQSLRTLAEKISARVIAEGVERDEERRALIDLGIELGQGFFFHKEPA
jgi:EAL domain-containing protein (putative c-di-GMP-specific phosphodiesterase class I)